VLSTKNASCVSHVVGKKLSNKAFGNLIIRPLPHTTQRKMDPQQIHLHGVCVSTLAHPFDVIRMDFPILFVYYETIKREVNKRLIYECRCDERLKAKAEGFTCLAHTGLREGLEHLKIETKLIHERFVSATGECVILTPQALRRYSK
jgi:hypothetical protein